MLLYEDITHMIFHTANEWWLEIRINDDRKHLIPANMLADGVIFLKINSAFVTDKFKLFKGLKETGALPEHLLIERNFEPCIYL